MSKKLKTRGEKIGEILEAGYWRYDAMVHGYGSWKGTPKTELHAFKLAASWVYVEILRMK